MIPNVTSPPVVRLAATAKRKNSVGRSRPSASASHAPGWTPMPYAAGLAPVANRQSAPRGAHQRRSGRAPEPGAPAGRPSPRPRGPPGRASPARSLPWRRPPLPRGGARRTPRPGPSPSGRQTPAPAHCPRCLCQQCGLRWAADRLATALQQDEGHSDGQTGRAEEGRHGEERHAHGGEAVTGDRQGPVPTGPVRQRSEDQSQHERHRLAEAGDQPDDQAVAPSDARSGPYIERAPS